MGIQSMCKFLGQPLFQSYKTTAKRSEMKMYLPGSSWSVDDIWGHVSHTLSYIMFPATFL